MPIIRHLADLPPIAQRGAVTIGNFDGLHQGHARIVAQLRERARQVGGKPVVFTFHPHPARLLRPQVCPPPLTWMERKAELLAEEGIDWVVAYPTDHGLLNLSPREFFERVIVEQLQAKALVEGPNFFFGKDRGGNVDLLQTYCDQAGILLDIVAPVASEGGLVSSSRIREWIRHGQVAQAHHWLTAPYRIRGLVTHGAGRGSELGFPTANLEGIDTLLPAEGVYAGVAWWGPRRWPAALHLGTNPTFDDPTPKVEVHLIGADETLYGQILEVDFLQRLRGTETFSSPQQLVAQLQCDVTTTENVVCSYFAGKQVFADQ